MAKKKVATRANNMLGRAVAIRWSDIVTHTGVQDNINDCGLEIAHTYGILVVYGKKIVKVASTVYEEGNQPADVTVIPRANVLGMKVLD